MCRCGEYFGCESEPEVEVDNQTRRLALVREKQRVRALVAEEQRMQPEVKEWLEHLEQLLMSTITIFRENHRYSRAEDALLEALKTYREQMENL